MSKYKPPAVGRLYVNAEDSIVGRLASKIAKLALMGYEVYVFNAEKAIITGKRGVVLRQWSHKILNRGDWYKGPFYPKRADRILKRIIRGMLPKNWRGRIAYSRIKVFIGVPDEFSEVQLIDFNDIKIQSKLSKSKRKIWYVSLEEVSKNVGVK